MPTERFTGNLAILRSWESGKGRFRQHNGSVFAKKEKHGEKKEAF